MTKQTILAFLTAAALTTGALAEDQAQQPQKPMQEQAQQTGEQMGHMDMGGAEMSDAMSENPDLAFAAVLISHARLQQQVSDLVAQKATNPQIKQLAQQETADYQEISQRVQQAAQKEGLTLHPERMLPRDRAVLHFLQQLPPDRLQRDYVFFEAGNNQTNLLFAQWAANNAQKPEIKQVAQNIATKLQERHQTIQQLAQAEVGGGGAQPAGEKMTPSGEK